MLKFALIGCGYMGSRYINLLSQHPVCQPSALIDTNCNRLSDYKTLSIPLFHSAEAFFSSNMETDAVIVASPNGTHASLAIASLKNNYHVLIEKPMALSGQDAQQVVATARQMNKKAMVVLQNRFSPVSAWLKELVESKLLGSIFFVEVNCFWNRDERYYKKDSWHGTRGMDGGSLYTQFSHFIDTLYWLFGDIKNIRSRFANFNHRQLIEFEDTGSIQFQMEQGGLGTFNFSTAVWDKTFESSMTIVAENGTVKISGQYMDRIEYCHVKNYQLPAERQQTTSSADHHMQQLDAFIAAIRDNGPTNAEEALHAVDIIERMYASSEGTTANAAVKHRV